MRIQMAMKAVSTAVLLSLAMACTQNTDEPIDAGEVAAPAAVPDPVDPIDMGEPDVGPDVGALDADAEGFVGWDANADKMLDANEFRTRFDGGAWYGDWDGDDDGFLSKEEFAEIHAGDAPGGVDKNGLFDIWDADEDGLIDEDEFADGAYATWDQDSNKLVDNNEFTAGSTWLGW